MTDIYGGPVVHSASKSPQHNQIATTQFNCVAACFHCVAACFLWVVLISLCSGLFPLLRLVLISLFCGLFPLCCANFNVLRLVFNVLC